MLDRFESYSQAGQDKFVFELCGHNGSFLDIGCGHPIQGSNTYILERDYGWRGLLIDSAIDKVEQCNQVRRNPSVCCNALTVDWVALHLGKQFDYLSLDIDNPIDELCVLQSLHLDGFSFRVMTVEHDSYRFGDVHKEELRKFLLGKGYILAKADVCNDGLPFEDWWIGE